MSVMNFQKTFVATPPDKGSFPLDHDGECKRAMLRYMVCLNENKMDGSACRQLSRDYLQCRMDHQLMAREDWSNLGFSDSPDDPSKQKKTM